MFCTVKRTKNKYAVYLSERVREDGKVKSKDKYIFSLEAQEIENGAYDEWLSFSSLTEEEKRLIIRKLGNMEVTLHDTTKDKSLHGTTRVESEIKIVDDSRYIEHKCYIGEIFIREFEDIFLINCGVSIIMKVLKDEIAEKGITDKTLIDELLDKIFEIWYYYKDMKDKKEAERVAIASYYENTIFKLQLKVAELQNNSSRTSLHATTDSMKVKKIYRALAGKLHPDNGGSDELMQMLNELKDMIS